MFMKERCVIVRGAGDLATGVIYILKNFRYQVIATEIEKPSAIRRSVALCEAVYDGSATVENVTGIRCDNQADVLKTLEDGYVPILIDPQSRIIGDMKPDIVVDAIIAKKNLGTHIDMAPVVIGLGPGFCAGEDVHAVVETSRGHHLGRMIVSGFAKPNTGVPGVIGGYSHERVIYAPKAGTIRCYKKIGDHVEADEIIADVAGAPVVSKISGILRGMIRDGFEVTEGFKTADVDPRDVYDHCFSISDKARMIGFGTLFAINHFCKETKHAY
jgi:xanthine dehydrogenase accessory factor